MKKLFIKFSSLIIVLLHTSSVSANQSFIGKLECKQNNNKFTWFIDVDEQKQRVSALHPDNATHEYNFGSTEDDFYFVRKFTDRAMRHEFLINRYSGNFQSIVTYDGVTKQMIHKGNCKSKNRKF